MKGVLALKDVFSKTTCVYLRSKFHVSSVILTSFRQGVILHLQLQNKPLKSPP